MAEHDKLALLKMINETSELIQLIIKSHEEITKANGSKYFRIVSDLIKIIHELIKTAEYNNCEVIFEGYKAVKIVEIEGKKAIDLKNKEQPESKI